MQLFTFPNIYEAYRLERAIINGEYGAKKSGVLTGTPNKEVLQKYANETIKLRKEKGQLFGPEDVKKFSSQAYKLGSSSTAYYELLVTNPIQDNNIQVPEGGSYFFNDASGLELAFRKEGLTQFPPRSVRGVSGRNDNFSDVPSVFNDKNLKRYLKQKNVFEYSYDIGLKTGVKKFSLIDKTESKNYFERNAEPVYVKYSDLFGGLNIYKELDK